MSWFIKAIRDTFVYSGRARRKEYWMFLLMYLLLCLVIGFFLGFFAAATHHHEFLGTADKLMNIFNILMFLPSLSVGVRRMHDTDNSGWFVIVPVYGLYLLFKKGDVGSNRFGDDPKSVFDVHPE